MEVHKEDPGERTRHGHFNKKERKHEQEERKKRALRTQDTPSGKSIGAGTQGFVVGASWPILEKITKEN